jgi:predicted RNA methylase
MHIPSPRFICLHLVGVGRDRWNGNGRVIDLGAGTGVLGIACSMLGADVMMTDSNVPGMLTSSSTKVHLVQL